MKNILSQITLFTMIIIGASLVTVTSTIYTFKK